MKTNKPYTYILIGYLIAFLFMFLQECKSQTEIKNIDKWAHFGFCYGISQTTYKIVDDKKQAFTIAFLTPMAIGTAKEGIDYLKGGKFSLNDLKANFMGALFGTFTYKVIINYKNRNKGNFENWNKKAIYGYEY